mmetsp:Transcript_33697/g.107684  ORF Transcript_33697/g.107684 Transcript_33697/m.107684 type:complete len:133 (+) Transcript_33697:1435-1833(+)
MCFFSRRALVFRTTALVTLSRSHGLSSLRVQDLLVKEAPSGGSSFEVLNPATEEVLARLPDLGREDALRAIDVAEGAFEAFSRRTTSRERSRRIRALSFGCSGRTLSCSLDIPPTTTSPGRAFCICQRGPER